MSEFFLPIAQQLTVVPLADEETSVEGPEEDWENEGGHMTATCGRVVSTPAGVQRYKVILSHHCGAESERGFASMREAEAFIKHNTPVHGPALSALYDRSASDF